MCKLGDVIVIDKFKNENGETVSKHSFVVVSDNEGCIRGIKYDFVANMLCSFHSKKHLKKKLQYEQNLPINRKEIFGNKLNSKNGFIKSDQLYYFDKSKIKYKVIAHIDNNLLNELIELIFKLGKKKMITNVQILINYIHLPNF